VPNNKKRTPSDCFLAILPTDLVKWLIPVNIVNREVDLLICLRSSQKLIKQKFIKNFNVEQVVLDYALSIRVSYHFEKYLLKIGRKSAVSTSDGDCVTMLL